MNGVIDVEFPEGEGEKEGVTKTEREVSHHPKSKNPEDSMMEVHELGENMDSVTR